MRPSRRSVWRTGEVTDSGAVERPPGVDRVARRTDEVEASRVQPRIYVEPFEDVLDMLFHRGSADPQLGSHDGVAAASSDEPQYVELPVGERAHGRTSRGTELLVAPCRGGATKLCALW